MDSYQRQQHLHPDKAQQYRQTDFQVSEFVHHAFQHEEEGTQAQNGKDIGKENNIRILGNREYCRDGVKGKDDIRELDNQQHHKQGGEQPATIFLMEEIVPIELGSGQIMLRQEFHHRMAGYINVFLLISIQIHLDARID